MGRNTITDSFRRCQQGEMWDMLAIQEVKHFFASGNPQLRNIIQAQIKQTQTEIVKAIGSKKFQSIGASEEFTKLYNINYELFEKIRELEGDVTSPMRAWELHSLNKERFKAKRVIQEKFFLKELQEIKL